MVKNSQLALYVQRLSDDFIACLLACSEREMLLAACNIGGIY